MTEQQEAEDEMNRKLIEFSIDYDSGKSSVSLKRLELLIVTWEP